MSTEHTQHQLQSENFSLLLSSLLSFDVKQRALRRKSSSEFSTRKKTLSNPLQLFMFVLWTLGKVSRSVETFLSELRHSLYILLCFTELCLKRSRPPLVATADFHRDRVGWERFSVANLPQESFLPLFQHDFDDGKLCPCSTRLFECPLPSTRYVVVWHLTLSRPEEKSNEDGNDEISAIKIHKSSLSAELYFCLNWEKFQVSFFIWKLFRMKQLVIWSILIL